MKYNPTTGLFYKSEEQPDIIGNTTSGKQVLGGSAESYAQDFDSEDHRDALKIHKDKMAKLQSKAKMSMLRGGKFNHKLLSSLANQSSHHSEQADWHEDQASGMEKSQSMPLKDSEIGALLDYSALEKGRGPDKKKRKRRRKNKK